MLTTHAPAKLNLYLHIQGKRADGYHLLESLVVFTEFGDVLTAEQADALTLSIHGEFADASGNTADNLVLRAAQALQSACHISQGAKLTLTKNIPVGAGLGGGSADAAAALKLLCKLWAVIPSREQLQTIAVALGADVAMCLESKPLIARGVGDEVALLNESLAPLPMVLVYPRIHLATPEVYGRYQHEYTPASPSISRANFLDDLRPTHNQLQRAAISLVPEVAEVLLVVAGYPQVEISRMCGSGSSCFAITHDMASAERMAKDIERRYPNWWVKVTRTI
ncbi:MAG: 4-(cytidine 5'-diphospho)-2-C-methyl-D-erythritol kinase [Alphaproteobacteria bacterium]|nr:4-(cytidine 5'-diphospho)-2-C-methyl-D-erythritol kinase [Alphaproteobacteria bacterium]